MNPEQQEAVSHSGSFVQIWLTNKEGKTGYSVSVKAGEHIYEQALHDLVQRAVSSALSARDSLEGS